jgi:hypothetical protein
MFAARYFTPRYFAPRYFPEVGATLTTSISPSGPTISNAAVSTAALTINDETAAIGQAVQFLITGVTANTTYTVVITVSTNSTPAQTLKKGVVIKVDA